MRKVLCGKGFWLIAVFPEERMKRRNQALLDRNIELMANASENRLTFGLGCAF